MPEFSYHAYDRYGGLNIGVLDANSETTAREILVERGLVPFKIKQKGRAKKSTILKLDSRSTGPLRLIDLVTFTRDTSLLLQSGLPLEDVLRLQISNGRNKISRETSAEVLSSVLNGGAFSDGLASKPGRFPQEYIQMVKAGEISGMMPQVFSEMSDGLERRLAVRKKIQSVLIYPFVLIIVAFLSALTIATVLAPSLAPIFRESGHSMPWLIAMMITASDSLMEITLFTFLIILIGIFIRLSIHTYPTIQITIDKQKLGIPFIGSLLRDHQTARFSGSFGLSLKAGVPLLPAFSMAQNVVTNRFIQAKTNEALERIREGGKVGHALEEIQALSPIALRMINVGEETGKLAHMLLRVSNILEQNTQRNIESFVTLLAPALTIAIAALVGSMIFSVMNAILSINEIAIK